MRISNETKLMIVGLYLTGFGVKRIRQYLLARNINHSLTGINHGIWAALEERVHQVPIRDIEHLKLVLTQQWRRLSQRFISRTIRQFRHRLQLTIDSDGDNIEHYLD